MDEKSRSAIDMGYPKNAIIHEQCIAQHIKRIHTFCTPDYNKTEYTEVLRVDHIINFTAAFLSKTNERSCIVVGPCRSSSLQNNKAGIHGFRQESRVMTGIVRASLHSKTWGFVASMTIRQLFS